MALSNGCIDTCFFRLDIASTFLCAAAPLPLGGRRALPERSAAVKRESPSDLRSLGPALGLEVEPSLDRDLHPAFRLSIVRAAYPAARLHAVHLSQVVRPM
jgi:hypothetical protein